MIDTVAWVHVEDGRILCARPRGDLPGQPARRRAGSHSYTAGGKLVTLPATVTYPLSSSGGA